MKKILIFNFRHCFRVNRKTIERSLLLYQETGGQWIIKLFVFSARIWSEPLRNTENTMQKNCAHYKLKYWEILKLNYNNLSLCLLNRQRSKSPQIHTTWNRLLLSLIHSIEKGNVYDKSQEMLLVSAVLK